MYGRVVIYTYDEDKKALEDKAEPRSFRSSPRRPGTSLTG